MFNLSEFLFLIAAIAALLGQGRFSIVFFCLEVITGLLWHEVPFIEQTAATTTKNLLVGSSQVYIADALFLGMLHRNAKQTSFQNGTFRTPKKTGVFLFQNFILVPALCGSFILMLPPQTLLVREWATYTVPRMGFLASIGTFTAILWGHDGRMHRRQTIEYLRGRTLFEFAFWSLSHLFLMALLIRRPAKTPEDNLNDISTFSTHFMMAVPIFWSAFRFPVALNAFCLTLLSGGLYLISDVGFGPFAGIATSERMINIGAFVLFFGSLGYLINITQEESRLINEELESRVERRTQALRLSENFTSLLIENIPDLITVKDSQTRKYIRVNQAAEFFFQKNRDEFLNKTDAQLFEPFRCTEHKHYEDQAIQQDRLVEMPNEQFRHPELGLLYLRTRKIPLKDRDGRASGILTLSENVSEKVQLEEQRNATLAESNARREAERLIELRDQALKLAAHEIKNPLAALQLFLELGFRKVLEINSNQAGDSVEQIYKNSIAETKRIGRLVDELLQPRSDQGPTLALRILEKQDLSDLIRRTVDQYHEIFKQADCLFFEKIESNIIADIDPDRIQQVVQNIFSNAAKYGRGTPVDICLQQNQQHWELRVIDHGVGIARENQKKIFERFCKVADRSRFSGMGVGLSLTQEIVEAHHGEIQLVSELGQGSTFIVRCPLALKPAIQKTQAA